MWRWIAIITILIIHPYMGCEQPKHQKSCMDGCPTPRDSKLFNSCSTDEDCGDFVPPWTFGSPCVKLKCITPHREISSQLPRPICSLPCEKTYVSYLKRVKCLSRVPNQPSAHVPRYYLIYDAYCDASGICDRVPDGGIPDGGMP